MGDQYQKLVAKVASAKKKRDEAIKIQYRRDYHDRIHDEEMERHLNNIPTNEYVEPVVQHQLLERTQVQEVMCKYRKSCATSLRT
jgi:acyl-ACP thioesterase